MKRLIRYSNNVESIFAMSNIRGRYVRVPKPLNFSFYFSPKDAVESKEIVHGLRVKPLFNPEKMSIDKAGTLKLHGDWEYIRGEDDKDVSSKDVRNMINFFVEYKTLFAAVWEKELAPDSLYDYFRGVISFSELIQEFEFYTDYSEELDTTNDVRDITDVVRKYNIFNLWEK